MLDVLVALFGEPVADEEEGLLRQSGENIVNFLVSNVSFLRQNCTSMHWNQAVAYAAQKAGSTMLAGVAMLGLALVGNLRGRESE